MPKHVFISLLKVNLLLPLDRAAITQLERAVAGETDSLAFLLRDIDDTYTKALAVSYSLYLVHERKVAATKLNKVACRALLNSVVSTKLRRPNVSLSALDDIFVCIS